MVILTSCTARKARAHREQLTLEDFRTPSGRLEKERALSGLSLPAGRMYAGDQHRYLMDGVGRIRRRLPQLDVSVKIFSAGYGLLDEATEIVPYEATFNALPKREARAWGRELRIAQDARAALLADLCFILLGDTYLEMLEPPLAVRPNQRLIFLVKPASAHRVIGPGITVVPAGKAETKFGAGLAALKGKMFQRFTAALCAEGPSLLAAVHADRYPDTFLKAVERGSV